MRLCSTKPHELKETITFGAIATGQCHWTLGSPHVLSMELLVLASYSYILHGILTLTFDGRSNDVIYDWLLFKAVFKGCQVFPICWHGGFLRLKQPGGNMHD